jgi:lipoprotein
MEDYMRKKVFSRFVLVLMLGFSLISVIGCKNASSTNSSNSDIATPYTITNNSSYTVTLWDSTASKTLEPGQQLKAWFDSVNTIYDVRYAPADKVKVIGSGLFYEFVDK